MISPDLRAMINYFEISFISDKAKAILLSNISNDRWKKRLLRLKHQRLGNKQSSDR